MAMDPHQKRFASQSERLAKFFLLLANVQITNDFGAAITHL